MKLIGITGGVGMGKSTAQLLLGERGIPVVDTDQIARAIVEPGKPALAEIQSLFGSDVLHSDGSLHRRALADIVFANPGSRLRLEAILHPRILACWMAEVEGWRRRHVSLGLVVIPLLFETDAASHFNATVCVACSAGLQQERLKARGWSDVEIQQRIAAQWPVERKLEASSHVVWTDGNLEVHRAQWDRILTSS